MSLVSIVMTVGECSIGVNDRTFCFPFHKEVSEVIGLFYYRDFRPFRAYCTRLLSL